MALAHKKGEKVRQVVTPIEGEVVNIAIVDDDLQYEVSYLGTDGEIHSRFFKGDDIEAVEKAEPGGD